MAYEAFRETGDSSILAEIEDYNAVDCLSTQMLRDWLLGIRPPDGVALRVIPDFAAALQRVTTLAPYGTVIVTGSVHTVGDALDALGVEV